ncbi:MAG: hypothetical protein J2P46_21005 [Zavarzinella sp.]|nr:hypothetical protein [Zavarzinella sp.]
MGPYYTTVIIPAVFRSMYEQGRRSHPVMTQPGSERDTDRTVRGAAPARQFPPPSFSSGWLFQRGSATGGYFPVEDDRKTAPPNNWTTLPPALLPEIGMLMLLVDALRPKRIASLHGKRLKPDAAQAIQRGQGDAATLERLGQKENLPAIYVDPRYSFSLQARRMDRGQSIDPQKFTLAREPHYPQVRGDKTTFSATDPKRGVQDDDLCLKLAQAVNTYAASIPTPTSPGGRAWSWSTYSRLLVVGNLLDMSVPTVHYAYEGSGPGFSLGDWGPVDVATDGAAAFSSGKRAGAAVYTFETFGYADSGAFKLGAKGFEQVLKADGTPLDPSLAPGAFDTIRCLQLQAYASALRWEFLEEYKEQKREDG